MEGFSEPAASFDDSRDNFMEFGIESCRRLDFETEIDLNDFAEDEGNEEKVEDTKANEQVFSVHSRIRKELIPTIGMEFESEDEAYKFYNNYAYHAGFGVRKSKSRTVKDGTVRERLFVCSAEGKRGNDKRDVNVKWHRAETRFSCQARMKVNCCLSGKYRVIEFFPEHTHETSTPRKAHLYRSHRRMSLAQIAQADMADSSGIAPKATVEFLSRQAGGRQNLGFIPDDYKNYLRSKRTREMMLGDTGGVLEYLQQMQLNDPNFFYAMQVDEDDLITNIDTCLKEKTTEDAAQVLSPAINNVPELNERIHIDGYQNSRVSGIKTKERVVAKSKRPKSCLENATRKKKARKKGLHSATHSVMPSALPTQQGSIACTMDMGIEETELHSHFVQQPHSTIDTTFGQTLFHGSSQFSQLLGVDNLSKKFPLHEQDPMPPGMQFIQPFQMAQTQLPDGLNFHGSQVTSQKDSEYGDATCSKR